VNSHYLNSDKLRNGIILDSENLLSVILIKTVVIGAINWDISLFVKKFPREGEEVVVGRILRVPGGKAGNVAVAAARLLGPDQSAIFGDLEEILSRQSRLRSLRKKA